MHTRVHTGTRLVLPTETAAVEPQLPSLPPELRPGAPDWEERKTSARLRAADRTGRLGRGWQR